MKGVTELEWPNQSSRIEPSPGPKGSATRRISVGASPIANSHAGHTRSRVVTAEVVAGNHEEEMDKIDSDAPEPAVKKRGGHIGRKRLHMLHTALSLDQQALLIKHHNEQWGDKPSYISMQEWAKEKIQLNSLPSRSLVA